MDKLISVIVPVYKVEKYLSKCVDSIINQTYKNLEIILVDDGSPDNSGKMCDEYAKKDGRIKVIHKENAGVSQARNTGIDVAKGDFIAFVDSDDFLCEDMYEKLISKQAESDADLVFCEYSQVKPSGVYPVQESMLNELCQSKNIIYFLNHDVVSFNGNNGVLKNQVMGYVWRILYKKSALAGVRFPTGVKYAEDVLFLLDVFKKPNLKLACVNEPLYNYLIRPDSAAHIYFQDIVANFTSYLNALKQKLEGTENENGYKAHIFFSYTICVLNLVRFGKTKQIKALKEWNKGEYYKADKPLNFNFKNKLKAFLIHHKFHFVLKLILKIYDRRKYD